jgi:hypothetical protein
VKAGVATSLGLLTSNVVRVTIPQPSGDDAAVWDVLKQDKKLAQFLQRPGWGNPAAEPGEADKLRELLNTYPRASQAASIRRSLDEHARNKALIEEMKKARSASQPQR